MPHTVRNGCRKSDLFPRTDPVPQCRTCCCPPGSCCSVRSRPRADCSGGGTLSCGCTAASRATGNSLPRRSPTSTSRRQPPAAVATAPVHRHLPTAATPLKCCRCPTPEHSSSARSCPLSPWQTIPPATFRQCPRLSPPFSGHRRCLSRRSFPFPWERSRATKALPHRRLSPTPDCPPQQWRSGNPRRWENRRSCPQTGSAGIFR